MMLLFAFSPVSVATENFSNEAEIYMAGEASLLWLVTELQNAISKKKQ